MSRQDRVLQKDDEGRYHVRRGMAKTALMQVREGRGRSPQGTPLRHAAELARGCSERQLERLSRQKGPKTYVVI
jgi:hypothetical protein